MANSSFRRRAGGSSHADQRGTVRSSRAGLPRLVDGRVRCGPAIHAEGDRRAARAARDRVGPDDVEAEAGEASRAPHRRHAAARRADVGLDARAARQLVAVRSEHLTAELRSGRNGAFGRRAREGGIDAPGAGARPSPCLSAVEDPVAHEGPERDPRARHTAPARLRAGHHRDRVAPAADQRQRPTGRA